MHRKELRCPAGALVGFKVLWPLRHDTGKVSLELSKDNGNGVKGAAVELTGYSLESEPIYRSIEGTLWQTLHMAGAQDITIERDRSTGQSPANARWDVSWSE